MQAYQSIVMVGSSGAGKTTLVNGLRASEFSGKLIIPKRYITRPQRKGDDLTENSHVTKQEFDAMVATKTIFPYWQRQLDNGRIEHYGFAVDTSDKLHVYSANNAFLRDDNDSLRSVLQNALVIHAISNPAKRTVRLAERSPDMSHDERTFRLSDQANDIMTYKNLITIDTTELSAEQGQDKIRSIVRDILEMREE